MSSRRLVADRVDHQPQRARRVPMAGVVGVQPGKVRTRLVRVMDDSCPDFPGLYAYYPSHRNASRALRLVIDAIRHKTP